MLGLVIAFLGGLVLLALGVLAFGGGFEVDGLTLDSLLVGP